MKSTRTVLILAVGAMLLLLAGFVASDTNEPAAVDARTAQSDAVDLLWTVPADSSFAIIVPNLRALSDDLAVVNTSIGLNRPDLGDMLGFLQQMTGVQSGLDDSGTLYVLFGSVASMGPGGAPSVTILAPVSDYAAFLANFGATAAPVSELIVPGSPMPYYARQFGEFAVLSPDSASVEAVQLPPLASMSSTIGTLGWSTLERSDISILVNVEAMSPFLRPLIASMWDTMELQYASMPETDAQSLETMQAMLRAYRSGFDAFLRDSRIAAIGLDVGTDGIGMTMSTQFREGTPLAAMFTEGRGSGDMLLRLPDRPYLMAAAGNLHGIDLDAMIGAVASLFPETSGLGGLISQAMSLMQAVDAYSMAWYRPDVSSSDVLAEEGTEATGLFDFLTIYSVSDGGAFLTTMRSYMESINGLALPIGPMPGTTAETASATYSTTYEASALEIESYQVDRFDVQVIMPPEYTSQIESLGAWASLFSMNGYSGFLAANADTVVMSTHSEEATFRSEVAQSQAICGLGVREEISRVKAMAGEELLAMEAYIDLGQIVELVRSLPQETTPSTEPAIPAELLPIGMFGTVRDNGLVGRIVFPMSAAQFLYQLITELNEPDSIPI